MKRHKIIYGVCGIGNGHTQRQLPLIEYFSKESSIIIFAYDSSYEFYSKKFIGVPNVTVLEVAVPFYVGNKGGIDFEATKTLERNQKDFDSINNKTISKAEELLGLADLVISDYEPISAQYAYKHQIPLITIDQQSKYLVGEFPAELNGQTYLDEIARLKMFFPSATARIACSFFNVTKNRDAEDVLIFPSILKDSIVNLKNKPIETTSILIYLSSQKEFHQSFTDIKELCYLVPNIKFHIFIPNIDEEVSQENLSFYKHGDKSFIDILRECSGIISTAGHTLLSEAMYLGIPVYSIPLPLYEQQMNAEVINNNGFGIRSDNLNLKDLNEFISKLPTFRKNILEDKGVLLRGNGLYKIIEYIENK